MYETDTVLGTMHTEMSQSPLLEWNRQTFTNNFPNNYTGWEMGKSTNRKGLKVTAMCWAGSAERLP